MKPSNWISQTGRYPRMASPSGGPDDARFGQRHVHDAVLAEILSADPR